MIGFTQNIKNKKNKKLKITFLLFFKICISLALVIHTMFSILFFVKGIKFLGIFNIFSSILYLYLSILLNNKNNSITLAVGATFIEVCIHMILCVYFIGWEGGFFVYPLCLIPATYFITINILKKDIYGHILIWSTFIIYQAAKIFADSRVAIYEENFKDISGIVYKINTLSACFIVSFLVYAFLYEMRDIQEDLKEKNKILNDMANLDMLTCINNRRSMNEKLKSEIDKFNIQNNNFCIAICDIDNFKGINDTYGHDCGDMVLKGIADILINNSKKYDIEVSRWGGEEFLILIRSSRKKASEICQNILNDIREHSLEYNNTNIKVTMTIGLGEFNIENNDIEKVLKDADVNLYKGKSTTKNCVVFD